EDAILVDLRQPGDQSAIGARLHPLRDDVGIEQEGHSAALRARSFLRLISMPDSRRGEAAKNSARLPALLDFRSHSSADTTTAAVRPCFVIVCGPFERACSISSLNRALASATVHCPMLMASPGHRLDYHHALCWSEKTFLVIIVIMDICASGGA